MSRCVDTHMATARALRPWCKNAADRRELTSAQIAIVELADEVIRLKAVADLLAKHDKALS
ncbi:hypothetical protein LCGC14_1318290 [marine sediment metagenome]|uniref:MarR family transcriptional regulator n=1 Tax=marine sediment metagenome TaxID=412755 RepID=A0A0F9NMK3_9ZZZZ